MENNWITTTFSFNYPKRKAIISQELCNIPPNKNIPSHLKLDDDWILAKFPPTFRLFFCKLDALKITMFIAHKFFILELKQNWLFLSNGFQQEYFVVKHLRSVHTTK